MLVDAICRFFDLDDMSSDVHILLTEEENGENVQAENCGKIEDPQSRILSEGD